MYRGLNVIVIVPVFNEEAKIGKVLARMPREIADEVLVIDDGSTDDSLEVARSSGAKVTLAPDERATSSESSVEPSSITRTSSAISRGIRAKTFPIFASSLKTGTITITFRPRYIC